MLRAKQTGEGTWKRASSRVVTLRKIPATEPNK